VMSWGNDPVMIVSARRVASDRLCDAAGRVQNFRQEPQFLKKSSAGSSRHLR
jgi:hypothetical protein